MNDRDSIQIVNALAHGVNPLTGDLLSHEHVVREPIVARALLEAVWAMEKHGPGPRRPGPERRGEPWSSEEDEMLIDSWRRHGSIRSLATSHSRTPSAIRSRLLKLGVIEQPQVPEEL